jgi:hypothetical protein
MTQIDYLLDRPKSTKFPERYSKFDQIGCKLDYLYLIKNEF